MVTQQETSTPMQEWVSQALERMKPILDGPSIRSYTGTPDVMTDILDRMEWLAQHFKVMPEPCSQDHSEIFKAGGLAAMEELQRRLDE